MTSPNTSPITITSSADSAAPAVVIGIRLVVGVAVATVRHWWLMTSVRGLFFRRGPSTITGLVSTVCVDAVQVRGIL